MKIFKILESVPQDVSIDDGANDQANCEVQWLDTAEYPFGNPVDQQDHKGTSKCSKEASPHVLDEPLEKAPQVTQGIMFMSQQLNKYTIVGLHFTSPFLFSYSIA